MGPQTTTLLDSHAEMRCRSSLEAMKEFAPPSAARVGWVGCPSSEGAHERRPVDTAVMVKAVCPSPSAASWSLRHCSGQPWLCILWESARDPV